ncbi:MAG: hypothetical protein CL609_02160 [Anaerolineaceae bacterium]|nr:hypothetical protein [Anaerolineaceae bacterium]
MQVKNDKADKILTIQMPIDSESLQEDPLAIFPIMDDFEKRTTYAPYIRFLQALGKLTMGTKNAENFMTNFDPYYLEALMMENPKILKEV